MTRSVFNHRRGTGSSILLSQDGFNRADSAVSLGNTDPVGLFPSQAWTQAGAGSWGIAGNQAAIINAAGAAFAYAYVDLNEADVDLQLTVSARGASTGILFRYVDNNNYLLFQADNSFPGVCRVFRRVAGNFTGLGSGVAGTANGDVLRIVTLGTKVWAYKNGALIEPVFTEAQHLTATKHGLHAINPVSRFDNWSARTP